MGGWLREDKTRHVNASHPICEPKTYRKTVVHDLGTQPRQEADSAAGDPRTKAPHGTKAQGHPCRNRGGPVLDDRRCLNNRSWVSLLGVLDGRLRLVLVVVLLLLRQRRRLDHSWGSRMADLQRTKVMGKE